MLFRERVFRPLVANKESISGAVLIPCISLDPASAAIGRELFDRAEAALTGSDGLTASATRPVAGTRARLSFAAALPGFAAASSYLGRGLGTVLVISTAALGTTCVGCTCCIFPVAALTTTTPFICVHTLAKKGHDLQRLHVNIQ